MVNGAIQIYQTKYFSYSTRFIILYNSPIILDLLASFILMSSKGIINHLRKDLFHQ